MKTIFSKEYSGESIVDIESDVWDCLKDPEIPVDEYNIQKGTFTVTITWSEEE